MLHTPVEVNLGVLFGIRCVGCSCPCEETPHLLGDSRDQLYSSSPGLVGGPRECWGWHISRLWLRDDARQARKAVAPLHARAPAPAAANHLQVVRHQVSGATFLLLHATPQLSNLRDPTRQTCHACATRSIGQTRASTRKSSLRYNCVIPPFMRLSYQIGPHAHTNDDHAFNTAEYHNHCFTVT